MNRFKQEYLVVLLSALAVLSALGLAHEKGFVTLIGGSHEFDPAKMVVWDGPNQKHAFVYRYGQAVNNPYKRIRGRLYENGVLLSKNGSHVDINAQGGGWHDIIGDTIIFSSTDGSDPRSNGKKYTITHPWLLKKDFTWPFAAIFLLSVSGLLWLWARPALPGLRVEMFGGQERGLGKLRRFATYAYECYRPRHPQAAGRLLWYSVCAVAGVSLFVHVTAALGGPLLIAPDSSSYFLYAGEIYDGIFKLGQISGERAAGYPALLALVEKVFGAHSSGGLRLVQHSMGFATDLLVFACAFLMTGRPVFSAATAVFSAMSMQVVVFGNYVLTETVYTFFLTLSVFLFLYARHTGSPWLFLVSMFSFGMDAWIRPMVAKIWLVPVAVWGAGSFIKLRERLRGTAPIAQIKGFLLSRQAAMLALGLALFFATFLPQQVARLGNAKSVVPTEVIGVSMWTRMMYWGKHEDMSDPDFAQFLKEYEAWRPKNPGFLVGLDWRHSYVAMKVLNDVRGYDEHKQYAWLKKTCINAFKKHPKEYFVRFGADMGILLGSYDPSITSVRDADSYAKRYPWVKDMVKNYNTTLYTFSGDDSIDSDKSPRWRKTHQGAFFHIYDDKENSLAKGLLLKMNDWYLASLLRDLRIKILSLLVAGLFAGLLMFRFLDYAFILGVCAYHILIPLLILAPVVRYRYPVNGLLVMVTVAGVWLLLAPAYRVLSDTARLRAAKTRS